MGNLVDHARVELEKMHEDPDVIEWYLKVVAAYASLGHSGGSAAATLPVLVKLLEFKNLTPLTDDPAEWHFYDAEMWGQPGGIWQNMRNSTAFSRDGGKTYNFLDDESALGSSDHTSVKS